MSRPTTFWIVGIVLAAALFAWIAANTHWADVKVPMPPRGEALTNPHYAAQRFVEKLGGQAVRDDVLRIPPTDHVIVLHAFHWNLSDTRRTALEEWVAAGGRLVVDGTLGGSGWSFENWSGIEYEWSENETKGAGRAKSAAALTDRSCFPVREQHQGRAYEIKPRTLCGRDPDVWLQASRPDDVLWAARDGDRAQVIRTRIGRGTVTMTTGSPFVYQNLFDGDHGWLFAAMTDLKPGDVVHFVSEEDHPSLFRLTWRHGGPIVVLLAAAIGLAVWRGADRFGPIVPPPPASRRSLAEQIRGTSAFAARHGGAGALHAACVRALEEAAARRIPGYAELLPGEKTAAIAALTGFDEHAISRAFYDERLQRPQDLGSTLALLETARRRILADQKRETA